MTYQAIINGARGLNYFGGSLPKALNPRDAELGWNWTFWIRVLKPIVEEIGRKSPLHPALVAPESRLPIQAAGEGEVMFESPRRVRAKDGRFTDWFAPFEVHVYRFSIP